MKTRVALNDVPWIRLSLEYAVITWEDKFVILEASRSWDMVGLEEYVGDISQVDNDLLIEMGILTQEELEEYYKVREAKRELEQKIRNDEHDRKEYERLKAKFEFQIKNEPLLY